MLVNCAKYSDPFHWLGDSTVRETFTMPCVGPCVLQTPSQTQTHFSICILRRKRDQFSLNSGKSLDYIDLSISNQIRSSHCGTSYLVAYHFPLRCAKSPPRSSLTDRHPCLSENHTVGPLRTLKTEYGRYYVDCALELFALNGRT